MRGYKSISLAVFFLLCACDSTSDSGGAQNTPASQQSPNQPLTQLTQPPGPTNPNPVDNKDPVVIDTTKLSKPVAEAATKIQDHITTWEKTVTKEKENLSKSLEIINSRQGAKAPSAAHLEASSKQFFNALMNLAAIQAEMNNPTIKSLDKTIKDARKQNPNEKENIKKLETALNDQRTEVWKNVEKALVSDIISFSSDELPEIKLASYKGYIDTKFVPNSTDKCIHFISLAERFKKDFPQVAGDFDSIEIEAIRKGAQCDTLIEAFRNSYYKIIPQNSFIKKMFDINKKIKTLEDGAAKIYYNALCAELDKLAAEKNPDVMKISTLLHLLMHTSKTVNLYDTRTAPPMTNMKKIIASLKKINEPQFESQVREFEKLIEKWKRDPNERILDPNTWHD